MASWFARRGSFLLPAAATVIAGGMTYVYLATVSRSLDDDAFNRFSVFWSASLIIGFGLYLPIEQEMARLGAAGVAPGTALRRGARSAVVVGGVMTALAVVSLPWWAPPLELDAGLAAACVCLVAVSALQFLARGVMLARGEITLYSVVLAVDSVLRVLFAACVALGAQASRTPAAGWAFAAALLVAIASVHGSVLLRRSSGVGETARASDGWHVGTLLPAALAAQLLLNAGPIVLQAVASAAGAFQATFNLSRIPLFFIVPLQALLVSPLVRLSASGNFRRLVGTLVRLFVAIVATGVVAAAAALLIGRPLVELVFGAGRALEPPDIAVLVLGVFAHVGLVIATQALIAIRRARTVLVAWALALVMGIACAWAGAGLGLPTATALGFALGSTFGWMIAGADLLITSRRIRDVDAELVDQ